MPSRELTYRVQINTGDARRQARSIRGSIERELKQITVGRLDTNSLRSATSEARRLNQEFAGAAQSARQLQQDVANIKQPTVGSTGGVGGGALGGLVGGIAGYLTLSLAQTLESTARSFAEGNTEIKRANVAFVELSGSTAEAQARLVAIQDGAAGAVSQLGAIQIANQAASLGLAQTAEEFKRLTEAARVTALISPVIHDVQSAISELGLASANLSFRRLDQLGLSVSEVRDRMRELQAANEDLGDSQAFLEASIDGLLRKGSGLINSQAAQASGVERFNVAINEFLDQEGAFSNAIERVYGNLADLVNELIVRVGYGTAKSATDFVDSRISEIEQTLKAGLQTDFIPFEVESKDLKTALVGFRELRNALQVANQGLMDGTDGALDYRSALVAIAVEAANTGTVTNEQVAAIRDAYDEYKRFQELTRNASSFDQANIARATGGFNEREDEDIRLTSILDQRPDINSALVNRAQDASSIIGIERAIATLTEQKALVDAAIEQLINSSVTDPTEIQFRLAEIQAQALAFFDQVEERASAVSIDFTGIDTALAQFDAGFVDFLPGIDDLRSQLIDLAAEIALTGDVTADQAAELEYLQAAASAVGGEALFLTAVTNELGTEFLATNETAALLIDQMYQAVAAYLNGSITAEQYAGVTAALGSQLLALASEAGVATNAINQLIAAQGGLTGTSGFELGQARGNAIGQSIATRQAAVGRDRQRREAERAAKEAARKAEQAQKKAAREAEQAFKKAAREAQRAFEEAARQLESDLRSIPGLFSRSQVTQEQLDAAESGMPQNFADDYIRRLEDEVFNGNEWAEVSIEEARTAMERVGVAASGDAKQAFHQFAELWESGALFADKENLKLINAEAVQMALDLKEKARQGQQNILEHFGVVADQAVEAVVTGAGGSVSGGDYTVPITAELIPMGDAESGTTTGLTSGVFTIESFVLSENALNQLDTELAIKASITEIASGEFGSALEVKAAVTSVGISVDALSDMDALAKNLAERLKGGVAGAVGTTEWKDGQIVAPVADGLSTAINTQIRGKSEAFQNIGASVADLVRAGAASSISSTEWQDGEIVAPIATGMITAINTQIRGSAEGLKNTGANVAGYIMAGTTGALAMVDGEGNSTNLISYALLAAINAQFSKNQNMFWSAGQVPAGSVLSGFEAAFTTTNADGTQNSVAARAILDSLTNGIRTNAANFQQRGATIAINMQHGFTTQFSNESFKGNVIAAGELMAGYLKTGILRNLNGVADAISSKVMEDLAGEIEAPNG